MYHFLIWKKKNGTVLTACHLNHLLVNDKHGTSQPAFLCFYYISMYIISIVNTYRESHFIFVHIFWAKILGHKNSICIFLGCVTVLCTFFFHVVLIKLLHYALRLLHWTKKKIQRSKTVFDLPKKLFKNKFQQFLEYFSKKTS